MNVALGIYGVEHGLALENHPSQLWVAVAAAMSGLSVQTLMPPSSITSVPQGMCYTNALGRKGSVPTRMQRPGCAARPPCGSPRLRCRKL